MLFVMVSMIVPLCNMLMLSSLITDPDPIRKYKECYTAHQFVLLAQWSMDPNKVLWGWFLDFNFVQYYTYYQTIFGYSKNDKNKLTLSVLLKCWLDGFGW